MSRRDLTSMDIRCYVEQIGRSLLQCRIRANSSNALSWQPSVSADADGESAAEVVATGKTGFDLADAWQKSGLSCKPDDLAASLLVYNLPIAVDTDRLTAQKKAKLISSEMIVSGITEKNETVVPHDEDISAEPSQLSLKRKRRSRLTGQGHNESRADREQSGTKKRLFRTNFYSMSYAASRNARSTIIRDGNQGYEPLVYFPPLFPGMLLSARNATSTMEEIMNKLMQNEDIASGGVGPIQLLHSVSSKKRKDHVESIVASSGKRGRLSSPNYNKATALAVPNSIYSSGLGISPTIPKPAQVPLSSLPAGSPKPRSGSPITSASSVSVIPLSSPSTDFGFIPSSVTSTPLSNIASTDQQGLLTSASKTSPGPAAISESESSDTDASMVLIDINDDFGLLGVGALPLQNDSMKIAHETSIETNAYSFWRDHFEPNTFYNEAWSSFPICDSEEASEATHGNGGQPYLDLMILFVKRRSQVVPGSGAIGGSSSLSQGMGSNTYPSLSVSSQPSSLSTSSLLATLGKGSITAIVNDKGIQCISGGHRRTSSSNKKAKKGQTNHSLAVTTNDKVVSSEAMPFFGCDASFASTYQPKQSFILMRSASGRSSGHSTSGRASYERAPVRVASVRIRYRLSDRISTSIATSFATSCPGPVFPALSAKQEKCSTTPSSNRCLRNGTHFPSQFSKADTICRVWTNAVMRLAASNAKTGDKARMTSTSQRVSLRRSLVSPCRVDFGPFHVGYLSPPGGMTGISPPRTRVGISLPMGVKVPQHNREQHQQSSASTYPEPWTDQEDRKLKNCVTRFGFNWHMASRAVTGVLDGDLPRSIPNQTMTGKSVSPVFRSARQCRERWQLLAKTQPFLGKEVRRVERTSREMAGRTPGEVPKSLGGILRKLVEARKATSKDDGAGQDVSDLKGALFSHSFEARLAEPNNYKNSKNTTLLFGPALLKVTASHKSSGSTAKSGINIERKKTALNTAGQKRQRVAISIPGCVGNDPATLQVVQSHQSHAHSVRAASSSSRGELWPLQLLDLAEKQRQAAEGVTQRQEVTTNMATDSRQHRGGVPAASHTQQSTALPPQNIVQQQRTQPTPYHQMQQQHQGGAMTTPTTGIAAPMQTSTQQQELVKQAARAAALGSPAPKARPAPTNVAIASGPSQHIQQQQQQQQHGVPMLQQQSVPSQQVTYMNQAHHQTPQQVAGVGSPAAVMPGHQQVQPVDVSRMRHQAAGAPTLQSKPQLHNNGCQ